MSFFKYPTGTIIPMASPVPTDTTWVKCDGTFYNGNDDRYSKLWAIIGTTYGGTGISSFAVPHLGGRVAAAQTATASGTGIDGPAGSWAGASSVTLTAAESGRQAHSHTITDPGHNHAISDPNHTHQIPLTATTSWVGTHQEIIGYNDYTTREIIRYDTDSKGNPVAVYGDVQHHDPIYGQVANTPTGYVYYPVSAPGSGTNQTQDQTPSLTANSASVNISLDTIPDVNASQSHENTMPVVRLHYLIKL